MRRPRVLALVMAGGKGSRLELLTEGRAKPAVPFAGLYRLIDFPLSNCHHAGITDVCVIQQFNPATLTRHLANGRPWDLDRNVGGLLIVHPHLETGEESGEGGWHQGTADALWRNRELIRDFRADALLTVSADAVYRLDYGAVVDEHLASGADATMVTTRVDPADAGRYGVVSLRGDRVVDYSYKPEDPPSDLVSNEVFVFPPDLTMDLLEELAAEADPDEGLQDVGIGLLPRLVRDHEVREHRFEGYWRDVGTVDSYWSSHMELVQSDPPLNLDDQSWPILTYGHQRPPGRIDGGEVRDGLVSPGALVRGCVERSVLGPGVVVEPDAVVRESVLLPGAVVGPGAMVERAILDDAAVIGPAARVGGAGELTIVGRGARVAEGAVVEPGGRHR